MKKYILTSLVIFATLPLFAFNFVEGNFAVNTELKQEINNKLNVSLEEEISKIKKAKAEEPQPKIVSLIWEQMNFAMNNINRNTKLRKNILIRHFVEEQEIQKQRYENMMDWDVPNQLYKHIALNYDIAKVEHPMAACVYKDETIVEVRFSYCGKHVIVYYDYKYANIHSEPTIREIIN